MELKQLITRVAAVLFMTACFILFCVYREELFEYLKQFLHWVELNPVSGFFTMCLFVFLSMFAGLSISAWNMCAGYTFSAITHSTWKGVLIGSVCCFVGSYPGSIMVFFTSRYLFRSQCQKCFENWQLVNAVQRVMASGASAIKVVALFRPFSPYGAFSYILGTTTLPVRHLMLGDLAMLPDGFAYNVIGSTISNIQEIIANKGKTTSRPAIAFMCIVFLLAISGLIYMTVLVRRELRKMLKDSDKTERICRSPDSALPINQDDSIELNDLPRGEANNLDTEASS